MPAAAQMYPGQDITVNPPPAGPQMLLYPGGKYGRVVRPLLQPGEADPNAPIHLHMPVHRVHVARKSTKPKLQTAAFEQPRPAPVQPQGQTGMSFSDLPSESASTLVAPPKSTPAKKPAPPQQKPTPLPSHQAAAAQPKKPAKEVSASAAPDAPMGFLSGATAATPPPAAKPQRVAIAEPAPSNTRDLPRHNSIAFAPGAEEPAPAVLDTVRAMAGELNNALSNASARIQLEAYGGKQGDKGSDARRLSLKRALIIRQLLIDDGIPSERIDVRAMGGASDGALDRVDIFVRA
jgi:outer membrane protein OmpA-like peptidoglycan-associated protein